MSRADEDEVFANSTNGLAYGMAVNYWFAYLRHLDDARVGERERYPMLLILVCSNRITCGF